MMKRMTELKREVKLIDSKEIKEVTGQDVDWDIIHKLGHGRISGTFARVLDK